MLEINWVFGHSSSLPSNSSITSISSSSASSINSASASAVASAASSASIVSASSASPNDWVGLFWNVTSQDQVSLFSLQIDIFNGKV